MTTELTYEDLPSDAKAAIERADLAYKTHYRNIKDPTIDDLRYTLDIAKTFTGPGYHTIIHFGEYFPDEPEKEALIEAIRALPASSGVYVLTGYNRWKAQRKAKNS